MKNLPIEARCCAITRGYTIGQHKTKARRCKIAASVVINGEQLCWRHAGDTAIKKLIKNRQATLLK